MSIPDMLRRWMERGKPIGFSPWTEGDGMLWGYLTSVTERQFNIREISALGKLEAESIYKLSKISYFDDDPIYAERLERLLPFQPNMPDETRFHSKRSEIYSVLAESARTREPIRVRLRGEQYSQTARIVEFEGDWLQLEFFDELLTQSSHEAYRRSRIESVRWRTASEEAEAYLLKVAEDSGR